MKKDKDCYIINPNWDRIYVFRTSSPSAGTDVEKMAQFSLYHPFNV